uniref:Lipid storage droplets surface-binding protein 2 n=1 Tax=Timema shepardi TaxID=629360 RepID=A0A7R9B2G3_TIMSH|nr:unnamed protein product [Timema shepardi]
MYRKMEAETAVLHNQSAMFPHLECVDRVWKLPVVESAWNQSADLYCRVKGYNGMLNWTLSTAEATMQKAIEQATPIAAPIAKKFESPIHYVDQTLCKGINLVEEKVPLVKEPPQQIYETAKTYVTSALRPACTTVSAVKDYGTGKAQSLKYLSLLKANEVLSTHYGNMALSGFDSTAAIAEQYLDYYLPATEGQVEHSTPPAAEGEDKVLNTVYTVGRLSNKAARAVYMALSSQVNHINKDNVQEYIASLVAFLHLTSYLNAAKQTTTPNNASTPDSSQPEAAKADMPTEKVKLVERPAAKGGAPVALELPTDPPSEANSFVTEDMESTASTTGTPVKTDSEARDSFDTLETTPNVLAKPDFGYVTRLASQAP